MARSLRIQYAGALYHVMARGNGRARIFRNDEDQRLFLRTLSEACQRTGWRVHAWVLMGNHYHLVVETPEPNLVTGMQWLQNAYTRRFNVRHRGWGRLFGDRYKAVPVEGGGYYYETLLDYVHLNPARAGLVDVAKGQSVRDYPWGSIASGYVLGPGRRPGWLAAGEGLARFNCADTAKGRRQFVERLEERARREPQCGCGVPEVPVEADRRRSDLRQGWYWGSRGFSERLLALGEKLLGSARHRHAKGTPESRAHGVREAERRLEAGLARMGWNRSDLEGVPGSAPGKVALAREIWENTTVSLTWIAEHLHMCSAANASQQIRRQRLAVSSKRNEP